MRNLFFYNNLHHHHHQNASLNKKVSYRRGSARCG